jgi:ribosomal protein S19
VHPVFLSKKFVKSNLFSTYIRNASITKIFIGKRIRLYSGNVRKTFDIRRLMLKNKLGDFSITKIFGSAISISIALKAQRKKEDRKKK